MQMTPAASKNIASNQKMESALLVRIDHSSAVDFACQSVTFATISTPTSATA
jgi:hypothetical protein